MVPAGRAETRLPRSFGRHFCAPSEHTRLRVLHETGHGRARALADLLAESCYACYQARNERANVRMSEPPYERASERASERSTSSVGDLMPLRNTQVTNSSGLNVRQNSVRSSVGAQASSRTLFSDHQHKPANLRLALFAKIRPHATKSE